MYIYFFNSRCFWVLLEIRLQLPWQKSEASSTKSKQKDSEIKKGRKEAHKKYRKNRLEKSY